jgi:hypothetical protein
MVLTFVDPSLHISFDILLEAVSVAETPLHNKEEDDVNEIVGVGVIDTDMVSVSDPQVFVLDTETVPPLVVTTDPVKTLFDHV